MKRNIIPCVLILSGLVAPGLFAASYDEMMSGDLSSDHLAPTVLAVSSGINTVTGAGQSGDYDYFTITVPAGSVLASVKLNSYTNSGSGASFFAVASGASVTPAPPNPGTAAGLLGFTVTGTSSIGANLLKAMSTASNGSSGFSLPLKAGKYSFWVQDTAQTITYSLGLNIAAVPTVKVTGKTSLSVTTSKVKIKGKATGTLSKVQYRVGTKGAFKSASGKAAWSFTASLKPGKNVISIQATGDAGTSKVVKVTVTYKP